MIVYKTKWKLYIADLYIPERAVNNIVILVPGLPKSSSAEKIIKTFLSTGSAVLYPNFSGTFDSGGEFDGMQCVNDVREFIEWAQQPELTELYFGKKIELNLNKKIVLAGMSFGAIASLLACNDKVDKLILLSPVLLFNQNEISKIVSFDFQSQMDSLLTLLEKAFPFTYRVQSFDSLKQFLHGHTDGLHRKDVENALNNLKSKTLIIHGKLDSSVHWQISNAFRKSTSNKLVEWKFLKIGHSTSSYNKNSLNTISGFVKN